MAFIDITGVFLDKEEYSQYERDANIVTTTITGTPAIPANLDQLTIEIRKARRNRDVVVASTTYTFDGIVADFDTTGVNITIDLTNVVSSPDLIRLLRSGEYFIRVYDTANPTTITEDSDDFFISLNDKGRMIKAYFHDYDLGYRINYLEEDKPLGTAGALKYLEGRLDVSFFVSNCDIIIHTDYGSVYEFHKKGSYELTLVGSMQQYTIPYGVCEIDNGGVLKAIQEKPQYDFLVNTGLYLLEPTILQYIPENEYFDMTDLIRAVQYNGLKVGVFPVSEKSWIDIGQWNEYNSVVKNIDK